MDRSPDGAQRNPGSGSRARGCPGLRFAPSGLRDLAKLRSSQLNLRPLFLQLRWRRERWRFFSTARLGESCYQSPNQSCLKDADEKHDALGAQLHGCWRLNTGQRERTTSPRRRSRSLRPKHRRKRAPKLPRRRLTACRRYRRPPGLHPCRILPPITMALASAPPTTMTRRISRTDPRRHAQQKGTKPNPDAKGTTAQQRSIRKTRR